MPLVNMGVLLELLAIFLGFVGALHALRAGLGGQARRIRAVHRRYLQMVHEGRVDEAHDLERFLLEAGVDPAHAPAAEGCCVAGELAIAAVAFTLAAFCWTR